MRALVRVTAVVFALLAGGAHAAQSLDTIIIDAGYDQQTRIAVAPFGGASAPSGNDDVDEIVSFDLDRSGQFDTLEPDNMLSFPSGPDEVFFRDWRVQGMEYLVAGNLSDTGNGEVRVRFWVFDVVNEREMLARERTFSKSAWRDMAHYVADETFEAVTGIRGAFSTKILYVLAENAGSPDARYSLELADADGRRAETLFSSDEPVMSPSWGPEGRRVAYVSFETGRQSIVIHDLVSGERELITRFEGINGSPVFSPDGDSMLMVLSRDGNPELYLMTLDDRRLRRLTRHHAIDTEPSFTPDGRHVVFTSDRGGAPQIYRLDLETNMVERLTFEGRYNARAQVLPDGEHLVYVHRSERGSFHIAWQDLNRDDVRVLTETSLDESPSLAPNGTMLMYATQNQGKGILAVVSIDGRVKYRLPSSSGDVREPAWSPYLDYRG